MTEAAPIQPAPSAELDADLINYEADELDTMPAMGLPSERQAEARDASAAVDSSISNTAKDQATTAVDINEIDWEDHDHAALSADIGDGTALAGLDASVPLDAGADLGSSLEADINGSMAEVQDAAGAAGLKTTDDTAGLQQSLDVDFGDSLDASGISGAPAPGSTEHEITYDGGELNVVEPEKDPEEDLIDYESFPDDPDEHADASGEQEAQHDVEHDEAHPEAHYDGNTKNEDQSADAAGAANYSEEQSEEDEASPDASEECPDITVNYQNEEFPLFHGQKGFGGQDGFFGDQSILDDTMDQLLIKFRQEIVDDLGPQDEVVLQIDEMGLEYAESTHRDHISGATLRQLYDIFEQLAKNQDPDANRTLYTNLLVRPHPAKRLELLIEEAFNGKGLEDVIYSFQSNHGQGPTAGHDGDVDMYGESSEGDEGEGSAEYDEEQAQGEDQEQDEDSTSHGGESDENADNDRASVNDDQEYEAEDDGAGLDNEDPEAVDELAEEKDEAQFDEYEQHEYDDNDAGLGVMGQPLEGEAANDAYASTNLETEHMHGGEGEADDNAGFDLLDLIDEDAGGPGPEQAERLNTSATVTLDGDGENEINYEDDADAHADMPEIDAKTGMTGAEAPATDSYDEIDWREPGEEDGGLKESASGSAKRPHSEVDVDLGLEDENDVKRRRS